MGRRHLVVSRKGRRVGDYPIEQAEIRLGRAASNAIVLDDLNLSRHHATVSLGADAQCYIEDAGSKNGTFVKGQRVSRLKLASGDVFTIGAYECCYLEDDCGPLSHAIVDDEPTQSMVQTALLKTEESSRFIGSTPAAKELLKRVRKVAASNVNVLITGESGTGKGVVARLIHEWSPRAQGPFIALNCAAIPSELIESELFGHRRGSFTGATADHIGKFQAAHAGSLFLDEVADMSLAAQSKILRAIEEQQIEQVGGSTPIQVDARVIAATNKDIDDAITQGLFRQDLLFRLATVKLHAPPLRERPEDITVLAEYFLKCLRDEVPTAYGSRFSKEALEALKAYAWPGNVRELRNVIAHAVVMKEGAEIQPEDFGLPEAARSGPALPGSLKDVQARHIGEALERHGWNISATARFLGVSRKTLREKIERHGLRRQRVRAGVPSSSANLSD